MLANRTLQDQGEVLTASRSLALAVTDVASDSVLLLLSVVLLRRIVLSDKSERYGVVPCNLSVLPEGTLQCRNWRRVRG